MKPLVSIIMGSTSDLPVMEKACKWLEEQEIPFEVNALSAHRTPDAVETFCQGSKRSWRKSYHCCGWYGCCSTWSYRCFNTTSSHWRAN